MKRFTLLLAAIFALSNLVAQNAAPVITNVSATPDTAANSVTITFDVADAEGDDLDIWIQASADDGATWLIPTNDATGDVGFPVSVGTTKSITWTYDIDSLTTWGGGGPYNMRVRVVADDRQTVDIADIVAEIDSANIHQNLAFIEGIRHRTAGPVHLQEVKDTIQTRMNRYNLHPINKTFDYSGYLAENFHGRWSGVTTMKKAWLMSGHFDSVDESPGADDNGSAIAALLEAARVLTHYHFKSSLKFLTFDLEEVALLGSYDYVLNGGIPSWEDTEGLLNMEMIGYYDDAPNSQLIPTGFDLLFPSATSAIQADSNRGNFLTNVGNDNGSFLIDALNDAAAAYVPSLKVVDLQVPGSGLIAPDLRRSDHAPFWDVGIPALMLTDGANFRNFNYHTSADVISTIDFSFMTKNVKAMVACLATLAEPVHCGTTESDAFILDEAVGISKINLGIFPDLKAFPNPSHDIFNFTFTLDQPTALNAFIINGWGDVIANLNNRTLTQGKQSLQWDGKTETGSPAAAGVYFLVLQGKAGTTGERIMLIR